MKRREACALLIACACSFQGRAAEPAPPHIKKELPDARLAGEGEYRWWGLKLYDAQLWVGGAGFRNERPDIAPFALDLRYARSLAGARIADASADEMEKLGLAAGPRRAAWLQIMQGIFPDVDEGTRLTGIFVPRTGVRFYRDGAFLADVRDEDFAHAFFAIWLAPETSAPALRQALLAGVRAR